MNGTIKTSADQRERLKGLKAVLRSDLQISRQLSERRPIYVIHDPISFQTHRLDENQYSVAVFATQNSTLGETFADLVRRGRLKAGDEDQFYDLVVNLYRSGIIVLPVHQGSTFYEQYEKHRAVKRRNRLMSLLFLRIPISNPNRFLEQTVPFVSFCFSRTGFVSWLCAGLCALGVLVGNADKFSEPLNGLLSPGNLPILWVVFVVLKLWHELGHGYACKRFGGHVPEMGTILIVGNPLAYVDATSAWSFSERWKRLVVMCGGIYFESLVAIPAVFVWVLAGHGILASIAYQVIITASVVTLLFNINPLMKFDGYFILSEILGIPNLRSRADGQIRRTLKSCLLGISSGTKEKPRLVGILLSYGVASAVYRAFLVVSIALLVASRFPIVGIAIGATYIFSSVYGTARKIAAYLLKNEETSRVRLRAKGLALLLFVGIPTAFSLVPVPIGIIATGIVATTTEHQVRVETPGSFRGTNVAPGDRVDKESVLFRLENDNLLDELRIANRRLQEKSLHWKVARERDVVESARIESELQELESYRCEIQRRVRGLDVVAPAGGVVLRAHNHMNQGQFLKVGESVGMLVDGNPLIRVWLTQDQLKSATCRKGTVVKFRLAGQSHRNYWGRIRSICPAAEISLSEHALTCIGGGDIIVDPETNRPLESLFEVEITPADNVLKLDFHGRRVALSLPRAYESIGAWTYRKCVRLINSILLA